MFGKLTLEKMHTHSSAVIVRVDFNVPLDKKGAILDDNRIAKTLPTIRWLLERKNRLILLSHLGDPEKVDSFYSLHKCATRLEELLQIKVHFISDPFQKSTTQFLHNLPFPSVTLIENLRFWEEEKAPFLRPSFAKELASLGDFYINEAFSASHRPHASIIQLPTWFPQKAAMGFLFAEELQMLHPLLSHPPAPFSVILGGAKVFSKIKLLHNLLKHADNFFIAGSMAATFLKSLHLSIGSSTYEENLMGKAQQFLQEAQNLGKAVYLPLDYKAARLSKDKEWVDIKNFTTVSGLNKEYHGLDIGAATLTRWKEILEHSQTIFWNGPLGMFENPEFAQSTYGLAQFLAESCSRKSKKIILGGGDLHAALQSLQIQKGVFQESTGGGASLAYLEQGSLPGLHALSNE